MQQQNLIQRLNEEFSKAIIETPFPVDRLSDQWRKASHDALEYASPHSLGVSAEVFKRLALQSPWRKDFTLSYFDFATLSNNLEARSAKELGLTIGDYVTLVSEAHEHVKFYSENISVVRKAIEQKVAEEDAMKKVAADGVGGLKPVKGEA